MKKSTKKLLSCALIALFMGASVGTAVAVSNSAPAVVASAASISQEYSITINVEINGAMEAMTEKFTAENAAEVRAALDSIKADFETEENAGYAFKWVDANGVELGDTLPLADCEYTLEKSAIEYSITINVEINGAMEAMTEKFTVENAAEVRAALDSIKADFETEEIAEDIGQQSLFGELDELALESEPYRVTFKYDGGISDYVKSLNDGKRKLYAQPIYYKATKNDIQVEFSIQHTSEYRESMFSFVNNIPTPEGGYHEIGFRSGLTRVLNEYARSNGFLKDKDSNFQGDDFSEGLSVVLSIKMANVQFEGQTKTKLGNTEARPAVEATVIEGFNEFKNIRGYKKTMEEIIKKAQGAAKSRIAAKTAKDNARAKNSIDGLTLIGKLAACSGRKPELNEMFIVEGDSAGGTAKQARVRQFQSILPLRGKPLNVEKKKLAQILENEEIRTMISAIGAGIDPDFKLDKINYHKVIILSDADQDGMHIRCILLTFFFRYMRPLVNAGHVYIGMPPLYKVYKGDKVEYAYDDKELDEKIQKLGKGCQLQRYKGLGEMNADQLWETTMNPATRNLIQVTVEDAAKAERMITTLMGDKVDGRKEFRAKYANFDKRDGFIERRKQTEKKEEE